MLAVAGSFGRPDAEFWHDITKASCRDCLCALRHHPPRNLVGEPMVGDGLAKSNDAISLWLGCKLAFSTLQCLRHHLFVLQEFFLKPVVELNKVIGLVSSKLLYYRPMLSNPIQMPKKAEQLLRDDTRFANDPDRKRAVQNAEETAAAQQRQFEEDVDISKEIRELMGQLAAASHAIRCFPVMRFIFRIPNRRNINEAIRQLSLLSYGLIPFHKSPTPAAFDNFQAIAEVERRLELYPWGTNNPS